MQSVRNRPGGVKQKMVAKMATCHAQRPVYCRGLCRRCYEKWLRRHNPEYAEKQRENCRQWCRQNKAEKRASDAAYRCKQDPHRRWANRLRNQYGITPNEYEFILRAQGGVCAICRNSPPPDRHLHIDHNHITGHIRGLLCFRCNFGLSYFKESATEFQRASRYLHLDGQQLKGLEGLVNSRVQTEQNRKASDEAILVATIDANPIRARYMSNGDRVSIRDLHQAQGRRICEIVKMFPQYGRLTIARAAHSTVNV